MKILDDYFKDCQVILIDIETTGLVSQKNKVILGGLLALNQTPPELIQFFAETRSEEKQLLKAYLPYLLAADIIISYNGDAFDLPFLNKRLERQGFSERIPQYKSFDLYKLLKKSSFSKILPNLRQKTVEDYLGISTARTDAISGKECIARYQDYQKTGNAELKDAILLHNRDDLHQLHSLMVLLKQLDLHEAMYHNGFTVTAQGSKLAIDKIHFGKTAIIAEGYHHGRARETFAYSSAYTARLALENSAVLIEIPFISEANHAFVDLTEFNFSPQEFEKYPGYQHGYLVVKRSSQICHAEINQLIRRICRELLSDI